MKKLIAFAAAALLSSVVVADGEATFNKTCVMCHAVGVSAAMGAPEVHSAEAWAPRLAAAGSIDGLVASATAGKGAMPPKGMCMDCSSADLKAAIEFMSK
ncbi:MAG: cytochrome c5 [Motiliproteus sp.]|jgi:cytochrome c5